MEFNITEIIKRIKEDRETLTKEKAFDLLFKAGIIDSDGNLSEHYR